MATLLILFLDFLRSLHFTRGFIRQSFRRWTLVLAFLGRRLGVWRPWNDGKRGMFRKAEQTERLFPVTGAHLHSKEYVIAASYAPGPASASHRSLHDPSASSATTTNQTPPAAPPTPINLTVEPRQDRAYLASVFDTGTRSNRSSANLSSHSRTSDRLRSHSRESLHAPVSQKTRFSRAPHRQFGRGPSPSPSREQSRSPSPADRVHQLPHLEIDITNLHPQAQVDSTNNPINLPSIAPPAHAPLSPPSLHGQRRRLSSTSVVVGIVNPSTDSLPLSPSPDRPPLTEEPYTIASSTGSSSFISDALDSREGSPDPTASSSAATSNFDLPEGRVLQLIHSEQVPRYTKDATVQVEHIITTTNH
ncbi:hypothetical protein EDB92DRAFT_1103053 [Lactarius akahatsu]|uniref:Uncharacterized protein n=1 Tax=Lactarius akahatsu TaxID=416441 RepID=A0AAD4LDT0_9AGAM|nr:hypothetical protein EDB92DRAFT_1103053 [Lactarius akahatsu]